MDDPQGLKLQNDLLTKDVVNRLPFEFFDLFAQIVLYPENGVNWEDYKNVDNFLKSIRPKQYAEYLQYTQTDNFLKKYSSDFASRYKQVFPQKVRYAIRRIKSQIEQGQAVSKNLTEEQEQNFFIAIDVDDYTPKNEVGGIDFEKLKSREKLENNIAATLSVSSTIGLLSPIIKQDFEEITTRGLINLPFVYQSELDRLVIELSSEMGFFFARLVQASLSKGEGLFQILDNLFSYYAETVDISKTIKYPPDLEPLETILLNVITENLKLMDQLNNETKKIVTNELMEVCLAQIQLGFALPEYYYKVELREASLNDNKDYGVRYSLDSYLYAPNGQLSKYPIETYGFIVEEESMKEILKQSFLNDFVFDKFIIQEK